MLDSMTLGPDWLTDVLRRNGGIRAARVTGISAERIGDEVGFLDTVARWRLTYDRDEAEAPRSLVVKISSTDDLYRRIGNFYDAYEREFHFYRTIAPTAPIRLPACYGLEVERESGAHVMLLEDLQSLMPGDQVVGLTPAQARDALTTIGRFHAAWWGRPELESLAWMPQRNIQAARHHAAWPKFCDLFAAQLPSAALALGEHLAENFDARLSELEQSPHTIVHSDFRADNLMFDSSSVSAPVVVLDWQLAIRGRGIMDVARLLCGSVNVDDRATHELSLLEGWHGALLVGGVTDYSFEQALAEFRQASLMFLYYPVTIHEAEEHAGPRGAALARAQINRAFTAALDWHRRSAR